MFHYSLYLRHHDPLQSLTVDVSHDIYRSPTTTNPSHITDRYIASPATPHCLLQLNIRYTTHIYGTNRHTLPTTFHALVAYPTHPLLHPLQLTTGRALPLSTIHSPLHVTCRTCPTLYTIQNRFISTTRRMSFKLVELTFQRLHLKR